MRGKKKTATAWVFLMTKPGMKPVVYGHTIRRHATISRDYSLQIGWTACGPITRVEIPLPKANQP